jgi:hypothetical protein
LTAVAIQSGSFHSHGIRAIGEGGLLLGAENQFPIAIFGHRKSGGLGNFPAFQLLPDPLPIGIHGFGNPHLTGGINFSIV